MATMRKLDNKNVGENVVMETLILCCVDVNWFGYSGEQVVVLSKIKP